MRSPAHPRLPGIGRRTLLPLLLLSLGVPIVSLRLEAATNDVATADSLHRNGPPSDPSWFPIAVWLQSPSQAARYRAAGINLYVGLWKGPTADQLESLDRAGMSVICDQNPLALANPERRTIIGWMHGDEPDNAQALPGGRGYGPPILPEVIVRDYQRLRAADPTRPVLLNLGQGVAWDNYIGRGTRRNHPEDYPAYVEGCDIASFDIYPAVHDSPEIAGRLEFVAQGVERLRGWAGPRRSVWNCIECTRISNPDVKPTPDQVRAEVWMSLIHGSRGLIYFVHQFKPVFREAALLDDPEMLAAVTRINRQVRELAPFLNSPDAAGDDLPMVASSTPETPIATLVKRRGGEHHVYAVNLRPRATRGSFRWSAIPAGVTAEVLGEGRELALVDRGFTDDFKPYEVHLYRLKPRK